MAAEPRGALIVPFGGKAPVLGARVFVAPNATLVGDVALGEDASVWFGAVLRADIGPIRVGARTNVQDLACLHMTEGVSATSVGSDVTVGHGAVLHGCSIGDGCLIGMGAIVLDNAEIGAHSVVAAGSLVPPRMKVPPRSMVRGNPARVVREVTGDELRWGADGATHYVSTASRYAAIFEGRGP